MILLVDSTSMDVAMGWQCNFPTVSVRLAWDCEAVILLFRHSSSYPTAKEKNRPSIYRESWSFADHVYGDQPERMSRTYAQTDTWWWDDEREAHTCVRWIKHAPWQIAQACSRSLLVMSPLRFSAVTRRAWTSVGSGARHTHGAPVSSKNTCNETEELTNSRWHRMRHTRDHHAAKPGWMRKRNWSKSFALAPS